MFGRGKPVIVDMSRVPEACLRNAVVRCLGNAQDVLVRNQSEAAGVSRNYSHGEPGGMVSITCQIQLEPA